MEGVPIQRHHLHSGGLNCTSQLGSTPFSLLSLTGPLSCASMPNATLRTQGLSTSLSALTPGLSAPLAAPTSRKIKKNPATVILCFINVENNIRKHFAATVSVIETGESDS